MVDFANKKVLVMGLGRFGGGADVVRFAHKEGAKITVTDLAPAENLADSLKQLKDLNNIQFNLGGHKKEDFEQSDTIIVNPAVPPDNEYLEIAHQNKKFITSQMNIFFELCPATIIGITGSNGKSTTAALTAHLLKSAYTEHLKANNRQRNTCYENIWLSGNIGNEPLLAISEKIKSGDLVVLELSSFQLEQLSQIQMAPKVALITNLTPNHLDRYGSFEKYCDAKETIFKFQKLDKKNPAVSIFNAEDPISRKRLEKYKNDASRICIEFSADDVNDKIKSCFSLPGRANLQNLAAALTITRYFKLSDDQLRTAASSFKALPHRLQLIAEKKGIRWYNDSKATTPDSTITALQAFDEPIILIGGGYDKSIPFDNLGIEISKKAKAAILIGQTAQKIANTIRNTQIEFADSLEQAVQIANSFAQSGDVVLLSPACASYDMFENYEHRGREFTKLVRQLNT